MKIEQFILGPVGTNCYIAINEDTNETLVVDPGDSGKALANALKQKGCKPVAILLTHGHFDHAGGIKDFKASFEEEIPVYAHEAEKETLQDPGLNLSGDFFRGESYHADVFVKDNETLTLAGVTITVFHTPGHTDGGCCFYLPEEKVLFSGDTLFCESVGRTDFPHGSMGALSRSIQEKLFVLPDDTTVYPGHNSMTTIGHEKQYNPFF